MGLARELVGSWIEMILGFSGTLLTKNLRYDVYNFPRKIKGIAKQSIAVCDIVGGGTVVLRRVLFYLANLFPVLEMLRY